MGKVELVKFLRKVVRDNGGFVSMRNAAVAAQEIWEAYHMLPEKCPFCGSRGYRGGECCEDVMRMASFVWK